MRRGIKLPALFAERVHFGTWLHPCYLRFHLRFLGGEVFLKGVADGSTTTLYDAASCLGGLNRSVCKSGDKMQQSGAGAG